MKIQNYGGWKGDKRGGTTPRPAPATGAMKSGDS